MNRCLNFKNSKNMNKPQYPFSLDELLLAPTSPYSPPTGPAFNFFDCRSHFLLDSVNSGLRAKLIFTNQRLRHTGDTTGLRRSVTVKLIDDTEGFTLSSIPLRLNIPKDVLSRSYILNIPFTPDGLNTGHTYKIEVHDSKETLLGARTFYLYDSKAIGGPPDCWFTPESGGIYSKSTSLSRCVETSDDCNYYITFTVQSYFDEEPSPFPEFEVRIHYPDGSIENRFCEACSIDYDMGYYQVDSSLFIIDAQVGITYAELRCMGYPVAGMVFSTEGPTVEGPWCSHQLLPIDDWSPDKFYGKLENLPGYEGIRQMVPDVPSLPAESSPGEEIPDEEDYEEESPGVSPSIYDEDFDRMLDDFIKSRIHDTEEPEDEEKQDEISEERTEDSQVEDALIDLSESMLRPLERLTGLRRVKNKLSIYEKVVRFNRLRLHRGLPALTQPLHAMFLGSPGTGKTTVARLMGGMLAKAGILSSGHVVVRERSSLLGPYYSTEETNTLKAIEEAKGGILFIDEAYQLYQPHDPKDPGKFVIETLLSALADTSDRDWMLILAGYPEEMKSMLDLNPGFKSRIPASNIYVFDDFSEEELMEIALRYTEDNGYTFTTEALEKLKSRLSFDAAHRDKTFGNARHVINLLETEILPAMAVRVLSSESPLEESLSEIIASDIPDPAPRLCRSARGVGFCA